MISYKKFIELLEKSKEKIYVPVFYVSGTYEWLPIDKAEYLRILRQIANPDLDTLPFPCKVEIESDGQIFLHPKMENR